MVVKVNDYNLYLMMVVEMKMIVVDMVLMIMQCLMVCIPHYYLENFVMGIDGFGLLGLLDWFLGEELYFGWMLYFYMIDLKDTYHFIVTKHQKRQDEIHLHE
jgi:hypothetical protein